jgi:hypothetical protein
MVSNYFNIPNKNKIDTSYFKTPTSSPQSDASSDPTKPQSIAPTRISSGGGGGGSSGGGGGSSSSSSSASTQISGGTYDITTQTYTDSQGNKSSMAPDKVPSNATIIKSGSDPIVIPAPTPKPKIIVEDVYGDVLDSKAYESYAVSKGEEFEAKSKQVFEVKKKELASLQDVERKRTLVKEKVIASTGSGGVKDVVGQGLAKKRSSSYELRQKKLGERVNKELEEDFSSRKEAYLKDVEDARGRFVRREKIGTRTRVVEYAPAEVSKESEVAGFFISKGITIYEAPKDSGVQVSARKLSKYDLLGDIPKNPDTSLAYIGEYKDLTDISKGEFDLKFKQAVESFTTAQTTIMKPLTESKISQKVSAVNTFIADTTNLFSPYKNLSEGDYLSAVVKTPSYVVGVGATAVGSVVGLSSGIGEFVGKQIVDYYDLQGSVDKRLTKLLSPESAIKTFYLPIEATKASSVVADAGLDLLTWEVVTGFSKTREVAGGVVKGTVESAFTDPIKFGVETLVFDKAFKGLKLATGFSNTSVAVESGKSLAKTSFLTKPVTSAYVQGENIFATTTYKVKVGGLLGRSYEVVSKAVISKDDVAKAMFDKSLLKLGSVKNVSSLVDDVSKNVVSVTDDVSVAVKESLGKSVTDLVKIDGGDLTKFVSKTSKSKAGRINLNDLVGDFVFTKAEGVTYVRPIGLLETAKVSLLGVEKSVGLKKTVIEAEKRVLGSKRTVSSVLSVESIAQVSPREIVSKSVKDKVYSATADGKKIYNVGLNQGVSDSTSLILQQTRNNLSSFRRVVVEPIVGKVKGFKTSITGTKGSIVSAESFVDESKLISPLQKFKTTDISFTTDAGEVVLSKVKVGKFPTQTVLLEPAKKSVLEGVGTGFQKPLTYRIKERIMNLLQEPQKRLTDSQKLLTGETFTDIIPKDTDIEKLLSRFSTGAMSGLGEASLKSAQKGISQITPSSNLGSVATGGGLRLLVNQKIDSKTDSGLKVETKTDVSSKTDAGKIRAGDEKFRDSFRTRTETFTDVRTEFAKLRDSTSAKSMFESASKQDSLSLFKIDYSNKTINRIKTETITRQDTRLRQDNVLRFDLGIKQDYGLKVSQKVDTRLRHDLQPKTRTLELEAQKLKTPFPQIVVSPPKTPVILKSVKTPSFRAPLDNIRKVRERITIRKTKPIFQLKADFFRRFVSAERDIPFTRENVGLRRKLWARLGSARAFIPTKELLSKGYVNKLGLGSGKGLVL